MVVVFHSEIKKHGMCRDEPDRECTVFCTKFIKGECEGMRIIKVGEGFYQDQRYHPFPMYKRMKENESNKMA